MSHFRLDAFLAEEGKFLVCLLVSSGQVGKSAFKLSQGALGSPKPASPLPMLEPPVFFPSQGQGRRGERHSSEMAFNIHNLTTHVFHTAHRRESVPAYHRHKHRVAETRPRPTTPRRFSLRQQKSKDRRNEKEMYWHTVQRNRYSARL